MSIEAMKFARDWIAEKPELRPCSAGKVVSILTRAIAENEQVESEKAALLRDALGSLEFYKRRCEALQQAQSKMRDPERTVVCDILANGMLLDPPGDRYKLPDPNAPLT